jgi:hypothetical protein
VHVTAAPTDLAGRFLRAGRRPTRGLLAMPPHWRSWLLALVLVNLVVPLVAFPRPCVAGERGDPPAPLP